MGTKKETEKYIKRMDKVLIVLCFIAVVVGCISETLFYMHMMFMLGLGWAFAVIIVDMICTWVERRKNGKNRKRK